MNHGFHEAGPVLGRLLLADGNVPRLLLRDVARRGDLPRRRHAGRPEHAAGDALQRRLEEESGQFRIVGGLAAVSARLLQIVLGVVELDRRALLAPFGLVQVDLGRPVRGVGGIDRRRGRAVAEQRVDR